VSVLWPGRIDLSTGWFRRDSFGGAGDFGDFGVAGRSGLGVFWRGTCWSGAPKAEG
jgi:hypothetical protein